MSNELLKDGYIVTMNPALEDQPASDVLVRDGIIVGVGRTHIGNAIDRMSSDQVPSADSSLEGLLEEPAIGTWAREAASEGRIPPLEALGLLAYALLLGRQR